MNEFLNNRGMNSARLLAVLLISSCLFGCAQPQPQNPRLTVLCKLPAKLNENSGLAYFGGDRVWIIEDNGNPDEIYAVNFNGELVKSYSVKDGKNHDWEDLAQDEKGRLFIGDFGNNDNQRKNLAIYMLPPPESEKGGKIKAQKISFAYPDQKAFPPKAKNRLYDAEAFFYHQDYFYLFTKNRTKPFSGESKIYRIPAKEGKQEAELLGSLITCETERFCKITSAALSPSGKTLVLMGYGKMWLIRNPQMDNLAVSELEMIDLKWPTQMESVCFKDENTLLISDEQSQTRGRYLYQYTLD